MPITPTGINTVHATIAAAVEVSARETAARVAAGAVAKKWLKEKFGTEITAYVTQVGEKESSLKARTYFPNPFFAANQSQIEDLENYMDSVRKSLDSVGANFISKQPNVPVGLGEPVFDRLDAEKLPTP